MIPTLSRKVVRVNDAGNRRIKAIARGTIYSCPPLRSATYNMTRSVGRGLAPAARSQHQQTGTPTQQHYANTAGASPPTHFQIYDDTDILRYTAPRIGECPNCTDFSPSLLRTATAISFSATSTSKSRIKSADNGINANSHFCALSMFDKTTQNCYTRPR